jgi:hypothetical protein
LVVPAVAVNECVNEASNRQTTAGLIIFRRYMMHLSRKVFAQEVPDNAIVLRSGVGVKLGLRAR